VRGNRYLTLVILPSIAALKFSLPNSLPVEYLNVLISLPMTNGGPASTFPSAALKQNG
jgi:hypothetical protein